MEEERGYCVEWRFYDWRYAAFKNAVIASAVRRGADIRIFVCPEDSAEDVVVRHLGLADDCPKAEQLIFFKGRFWEVAEVLEKPAVTDDDPMYIVYAFEREGMGWHLPEHGPAERI